MANSLFLDIELLENNFRDLIKSNIKTKESIDFFGELYLIPMDSDLNSKSRFPSIYIEVSKNGPYTPAQEDIEVEPYSRFSVTVETYTTGSNRKSKNLRLARFITYILQSRQQLNDYYSRGLRLDQEQELSSFVDGVNRRVLRFSGIVSNASNLILNKEI